MRDIVVVVVVVVVVVKRGIENTVNWLLVQSLL
jgi:hypothetical protein